MQDGTPWPGNNTRDHPGMIQVAYCSYKKLRFYNIASQLFYYNHLVDFPLFFICFLGTFPSLFTVNSQTKLFPAF